MQSLRSLGEALHRASKAQGIPLPDARALIFVGETQPGDVDALRASMPSLSRWPLCIEERSWAGVPVDAEDPASWIARRLLSHRASPAHTLFVELADGPGDSRFRAAARDLVFADGVGLSAVLAETTNGIAAGQLARCWAEAIAPSSPFAALRIALGQAAKTTPDPALCRTIMQAWLALEHPARALEWLPMSGLKVEDQTSIAEELAAESRAMAAREAACLEVNLQHLHRTFPELARALASADASGVERVWLPQVPWVLVASDAARPIKRADYPLLVRVAGTTLVELNRPESPLGFLDALQATGDVMTGHVCIGNITRLDALANPLRNRLRVDAPNRRQQLYGLAPDLCALRRLLEVEDLRTLLDPRQIELHWGVGATESLVAELRAHPRRPLPGLRLAVAPGLEAALCGVADERLAAANHFSAVVERDGRDDRSQALLAKLVGGESLKIWSWTSRHTTVLQHTIRDLAAGFEALGHRFDVLIEGEDRELIDRRALHESLGSARPDLIVMLDHVRPEYGTLFPTNIPWVNWVLDDLPALHDASVISKLGPLDFCFAWGPSLATAFSAAGHPHAAVLPFATNPELYASGEEHALDDAVAFATHLSLPPDPAFAIGLNRRLEAILSEMDPLPSGNSEVVPVVARALDEGGYSVPQGAVDLLRFQATAVSRHVDRLRVADAVLRASLPLACYGRGWETISRFAPFARGLVGPGEPLRRMYARHKVVLHINTRCNMHPRVLEAMSSGGFVLARSDGDFDRTEGGLAEHFDLDHEICLFTSEEDMVDKIRKATTDAAWRDAFVRAGRSRVISSHTFVQRARTILEQVTRELAQRAARGGKTRAA